MSATDVAAPTTKSYPLSEKQFALFIENRDKTQKAAEVFRTAQEHFNAVGALILDAHGISADAEAQIDEPTKSIVVRLAPATPPAPPAA